MKFVITICLLSFIHLPHALFGQDELEDFYLVPDLDTTSLSEDELNLIQEQLVVYHSTESDSLKLTSLRDIVEGIYHPVWQSYNKLMYEKAKEASKQAKDAEQLRHYRMILASAVSNFGYAEDNKGHGWKAISYYKEAKGIAQEIRDTSLLQEVYLSMSVAYFSLGEVELSNEMDYKAIALAEEREDLNILVFGHKNQAMKLMMNKDLDRALVHGKEAVKYAKLMDDSPAQYGRTLVSLGQIYSEMGEDSIAAIHFSEGLPLVKANSGPSSYNTQFLAYAEACENRIGNLYEQGLPYQWLVDSTERVINRVLKTSKAAIDITSKIRAYKDLGQLNLYFGDLKKAKIYADSSYFLAQEITSKKRQMHAALLRYKVYRELGDYKTALIMHTEFKELDDKIQNSDALRRSEQREMQLAHTFEVTKDSLENAKQMALADKELEIRNERIAAEQQQKYILFASAGILGALLFFLFKKFKQTNEQKQTIEAQKSKVEEQKEEILDSIKYAKRIQTAILPPDDLFHAHLKDAFVFYRPKDIVAGDFYWLEPLKDSVIFAAADCTGHGVPGAMVSVLCNNALNRSVREFGLTEPGEVLNKTRDLVIDEFQKSKEQVRDGMDIALVAIETDPSSGSTALQYSGAHNPLWIIRKESDGIEEIKGDKQPIGNYSNSKPFETHTVDLKKGDLIYVFSDGYADQFGGDHQKKFKAKNFKQLLLSMRDKPMSEQKELLAQTFDEWKGNLEQLDDVCVIGLRV